MLGSAFVANIICHVCSNLALLFLFFPLDFLDAEASRQEAAAKHQAEKADAKLRKQRAEEGTCGPVLFLSHLSLVFFFFFFFFF